MTSNLDKFILLLWKNWVLQWNQKTQFAIELLVPVLFSLLLVFIRTLVVPHHTDTIIYNQSLPIDSIIMLRQYIEAAHVVKIKYSLAYSPNSSEVCQKIIEEAAKSLKVEYEGYHNSKTMARHLKNEIHFSGVDFGDSMANKNKYPERIKFKIRFPSEIRTAFPRVLIWRTDTHFPEIDSVGPRNKKDKDGGLPAAYLREGFLPVQNAVSLAFIKLASGSTETLPRIRLQRYPYPAFIDDVLLVGLSSIVALMMLLSYVYPCTYVVKYVGMEKEKQLKEAMKIMGLQNWLHWAAWSVKIFMTMGLSSFIITLVLLTKWSNGVAVFTYSSFTAFLFFLIVYVLSTITLCFMLSSFFDKASTAGAVAGLYWFITFIPYTFFQIHYSTTSIQSKIFWSIFSNTAMGLGIHLIVDFESQGVGLQWGNMFTPKNLDDPLTMHYIIGMMFLSGIINMAICLYLEQVRPGQFGVPKEWNFPFKKSYWCPKPVMEDDWNVTERNNKQGFEDEPTDAKVGVRVINLTKKFGEKTAVNHLSINMYENEITVLLGHNGAGKTTTISMLTGMIPPTSGTTIINGFDIRNNMDGARQSLSICPQHNILFDDLTVRDHLVFYSRLKGFKGKALEEEVQKYITMIGLEKKANTKSSKLSGGMKRKLSVCAAFCGDTKVVLCDEPSSGMDPSARRQLWDLLQTEKRGRTVLLTTHFMDEADVLGDRIAIMSGGELKCMGTSFFLKKKFGSGYQLICAKEGDCDSTYVTKLLNKHIKDLKIDAETENEISYKLEEKDLKYFESMLKDLETNSENLGLSGFGISLPGLEEVFLKMGSDIPTHDGPSGGDKPEFSKLPSNDEHLNGLPLAMSRWQSQFLKKKLFLQRNKLLYLLQNGMAVIFVSISILVSSSFLPTQSPVLISLLPYKKSVTILETADDVAPGSIAEKVAQNYKKIINSLGPAHKLIELKSTPFVDFILRIGKKFQFRVNNKYLVAATIHNKEFIAWLNNKAFHTAPLTVNLIHNAMAKSIIGPAAEISVINAPLPYTQETYYSLANKGFGLGTQIALNFSSCMALIMALYALFIIKEHRTRSDLLQFIGGVKGATFWISHFLCDLFTYTFTALVAVMVLWSYQQEGYETFEELGSCFLILFAFGCAALPFTYVVSKYHDDPAEGFSKISVMYIFLGVALFICITAMKTAELHIKDVADNLERYCLVLPHFTLASALNQAYLNNRLNKVCAQYSQIPKKIRCIAMPHCCNPHPIFGWDKPGVLRHMIYFSFVCVVLLILLIIKQYRAIYEASAKIKHYQRRHVKSPSMNYYDMDVDAERNKVRKMTRHQIRNTNLVIDRIIKYYGTFLAVNQVSVAVKKGECFGLLGLNGAGKTTTFKMLTGDESISAGHAYVRGISLKRNMTEVYREIGYCPQFDALFDDFTGREVLRIYALIHGIRPEDISWISEYLANAFEFMAHYNKPVHAYSGGNKRKLSAAVAIIGNPSVVYLDEPTSGMDPGARRRLWNVVSNLRESGKSVVLTSHSMEECEALCTRLAVMVNGQFMCIGSIQHLRIRFAKGLILRIKLRDTKKTATTANSEPSTDDRDKVIKFIMSNFSEAYVDEQFQGLVCFHIPMSESLWSKLFGLMEANRASLNIEDYSISQTSLEAIFLQFSKYQAIDTRHLVKQGYFERCCRCIMCLP